LVTGIYTPLKTLFALTGEVLDPIVSIPKRGGFVEGVAKLVPPDTMTVKTLKRETTDHNLQ
jgi:hypothetical protein